MGIAAANVGRFDLRDGLRFVEELGKEARVPWVSSNLRRKDGSYPFPRYRVLRRGERSVAVLGLLPPDPGRDASLGIEVLDPVDVARAVLKQLPEVDAVLCLSNLGLSQEQRLASAVPGLTAIVGGGSAELLSEPQAVGETLLLHAGEKGRYLGVLDLSGASFERRTRQSGGSAGDKARPLSHAHRVITLDASVGDDPQIAGWIAAYRGAENGSRNRAVPRAEAPPPAPKPSDR
jgi:2',3'-cyclic-nucleotide 2'-phosphodiesterase (5'-nucleotidase family)